MQLHKHGFMRGITIFSLAVLLFIGFGWVSAPAVHAAGSIDDLKAQLSALGEREEENERQLRALRSQPEGDAGQSELIAWQIKRLEREAGRIGREKAGAEAEIDRWYASYHAALEAASGNAGGMAEAEADELVWPMPGYTCITCFYGGGHRGVDIAGGGIYGEPIVAAGRGTVTYSGWMDSYGNCVFIDHGDGITTRYAHASAVACSAGDTVRQGETIAYVGSTGYSTGPHLHFEVLDDGSTTDPFNYF